MSQCNAIRENLSPSPRVTTSRRRFFGVCSGAVDDRASDELISRISFDPTVLGAAAALRRRSRPRLYIVQMSDDEEPSVVVVASRRRPMNKQTLERRLRPDRSQLTNQFLVALLASVTSRDDTDNGVVGKGDDGETKNPLLSTRRRCPPLLSAGKRRGAARARAAGDRRPTLPVMGGWRVHEDR
uniref:Uncharacterized protein n=1 Tax=Plectus sambesii TaxID=2011161 RepID=A0A914VSE4_9BILA